MKIILSLFTMFTLLISVNDTYAAKRISREQLLKNIEVNYHKLNKVTSAKIDGNNYTAEGEIGAIPRKTVPNSSSALPVDNMIGAFGDKIQFMYSFEFASGSLRGNIYIRNTTPNNVIVKSGVVDIIDWDTGELIGVSEFGNGAWNIRGSNEWQMSGLSINKRGAGRKFMPLKSSETSRFKYRISATIE